MARIRTIKPEFWKHEGLSALPEATHMLAAALLNYADDEGYFNANPALIKAECFPLRDPSVSIQESLTQLSNEGFLKIGTGENGRRYGWLPGFTEHQRVNRPTPSKIKDLSIVWDSSLSAHTQLTEDSPPERNREQGKEQGTGNREQGKESMSRAKHDDVAAVFDHWRITMNHAKARLDDKRKKQIAAALKLGYSVDDLKRSITGYSRSPFHMGINDNGQRYDGLDLILRNAEKIDKGLQFHDCPPKIMGKQARIEAINQQAVDDFVRGVDPFGDGETIDGYAEYETGGAHA